MECSGLKTIGLAMGCGFLFMASGKAALPRWGSTSTQCLSCAQFAEQLSLSAAGRI